MTREVWMPVLGYEGQYEVSNLGAVRRDAASGSGRTLLPTETGGYLVVSLSLKGVVTNHRVHRIVLSSFCGSEQFEGAHAAHNDGIPLNCRLDNLPWATPRENQADVERHGNRCKGEAVYGAVLTEDKVKEIRRRLACGERNPSIANDFEVSISTVHLIRHNKIWRHVA